MLLWQQSFFHTVWNYVTWINASISNSAELPKSNIKPLLEEHVYKIAENLHNSLPSKSFHIKSAEIRNPYSVKAVTVMQL